MAILNHSQLPRRGKAIARNKVANAVQAMDYAAGGFHVCVDREASTKGGTSTAWANAGAAYVVAYTAATTVGVTGFMGPVLSALASADAKADGANRVTAQVAGKPAPPPPDPNVPLAEQPIGAPSGLSMEIGGIPLWALALPVGFILYKKFIKKGRGGSRRRRR